jgi:hypothetical protein
MTFTRKGPGTKDLTVALKGFEGLQAKVGWFETDQYPEGTPVAYVATIHEFGTSRIPARPFMRPAVADHGGQWIKQLASGAKAALRGSTTPAAVLELVAVGAAGNVAEKIAAVTSPPLSPITIARKGFATPLVESGRMGQSVTGVIEKT